MESLLCHEEDLDKRKGHSSTCEKAIIEWIKFFKFNMRLQLAVKVTVLDGFQAAEGTAGHREAAESFNSSLLPFECCLVHALHRNLKILL